jgi:hypothetical protein
MPCTWEREHLQCVGGDTLGRSQGLRVGTAGQLAELELVVVQRGERLLNG